MNTDNASLYVKWLKQEVAPALGCTEPVAISFAAAYAAQYLDQPCTKISGFISANLYKNAMGRHHTRHHRLRCTAGSRNWRIWRRPAKGIKNAGRYHSATR